MIHTFCGNTEDFCGSRCVGGGCWNGCTYNASNYNDSLLNYCLAAAHCKADNSCIAAIDGTPQCCALEGYQRIIVYAIYAFSFDFVQILRSNR